MKFLVLSRQAFEEYNPSEPFIAISITDPNSKKVNPINPPQAMLSLEFYDLDKDTEVFPYSQFMFTEKDACSILNFVEAFKEETDLIVVHCEAGISRSAGVAGALSKIYNKSDEYYFKNYLPNMLVYRTILTIHEERKNEI